MFNIGDIVVGTAEASMAYACTREGVKLKVTEINGDTFHGETLTKDHIYPGLNVSYFKLLHSDSDNISAITDKIPELNMTDC